MNLWKTEAYITKSNVIKFGSDDNKKVFTIVNPIKGVLNDIEPRLNIIMELNKEAILELEFFGGCRIYLTNIGKDPNKEKCYLYALYFTKEDAFGRDEGGCTVCEAEDWDMYKNTYIHKDVTVRGVIRKGYCF